MPVPKGLDLDAVIHEPELSEEVGQCAPLAQDNARGALWPLRGAGRIRCPRTARRRRQLRMQLRRRWSRHTHGFHLAAQPERVFFLSSQHEDIAGCALRLSSFATKAVMTFDVKMDI